MLKMVFLYEIGYDMIQCVRYKYDPCVIIKLKNTIDF